MGGDDGDEGVVVDGEMRVRGIGGLRVVDASVMRRAARQWRGALPPSRSSPPIPPSPPE